RRRRSFRSVGSPQLARCEASRLMTIRPSGLPTERCVSGVLGDLHEAEAFVKRSCPWIVVLDRQFERQSCSHGLRLQGVDDSAPNATTLHMRTQLDPRELDTLPVADDTESPDRLASDFD